MKSNKQDRLSSVPLMNLHERRNYASNVDQDFSDQEVEEFSRDPLESVLMQMRLWPQAISRQQCVQSSCFFSAISLCVGFLLAYLLFLLLYPSSNICVDVDENVGSLSSKLERGVNSESILFNLRNLTEKLHQVKDSDEEDKLFSNYVANQWMKYGLENVKLQSFTVNLTLPSEQAENVNSLKIVVNKEKTIFEANLTQSLNHRYKTKFSPYSKSEHTHGEELIYVNFGRNEDFDLLENLKINVSKKIILVRLGLLSVPQIVENGERRGVNATLFYVDPEQKIPISEEIDLTSPLIGDEIKTPKLNNIDQVKQIISGISVLPISSIDAMKLFNLMSGEKAPTTWIGTLNCTYRLKSNFPSNFKIHLRTPQDIKQVEIYNVIGTLKGSLEPDRYVLVGASRNLETNGGLSSTAVLIELIKSFSSLVHDGWRPRRTIIFCNWDVTGSLYWVEKYSNLLSTRAVAYVNIDVASQGYFSVHSIPTLFDIVSKSVKKFAKSEEVKSRRKSLDDDLNSKSTFASYDILYPGFSPQYDGFLNILGIPVIDVCYSPGTKVGIADQTTNNNTTNFVTVAQVVGDLVISLAEFPLLPFNVADYAKVLNESFLNVKGNFKSNKINYSNLENAIKSFSDAAKAFDEHLKNFNTKNPLNLCAINDRLIQVERAFLRYNGLSCLPKFRHCLFSTTKLHENNKIFPCLQAWIERSKSGILDSDIEKIEKDIWSISSIIDAAANTMQSPF